MTKAKRRFYRIKEMKRQGLNYQQRAAEIAKMKASPDVFAPQPVALEATQSTGTVRKSFWQKIVAWLKNLFYGRTNSKN